MWRRRFVVAVFEEGLIKEKVATGLYNNASEVVREALRLMELRDRSELVREAAGKGFGQLRQGKTVPLDMKRAKKAAIAKKGRTVSTCHPVSLPLFLPRYT